jgi:hypothetical protein
MSSASNRDCAGTFGVSSNRCRTDRRLSLKEVAAARERRLEAMHLQEIEGNPLDAEDIAMFEMFEREGWDDERCLAYIRARALKTQSD